MVVNKVINLGMFFGGQCDVEYGARIFFIFAQHDSNYWARRVWTFCP
jgi:hypothetical protein